MSWPSVFHKALTSLKNMVRQLSWQHWSIRQRILLIAIFPIVYLFGATVWYSYYSRFKEVHEDLDGRAKLISTALAEGLEQHLVSSNDKAVKQMIYGVMQSDRSIYRIDVYDPFHQEITHVENSLGVKPESHSTELPILKQVIWANILLDETSKAKLEKSGTGKERSSQVLGFVKVTMTHSYLLARQKVRFGVELFMSVLALSISGVVAWMLSTSLTRPLRDAIEVLRSIRAGQTKQELELSSGGEIGELQQSINEMAESLDQARQNLEAKVAERTHELMLSRNEALKADAEKRRLIQKVNAIVEAERQSIAVEIHDELNASLIAVRLEAERIARIAAKAQLQSETTSDPKVFDDIQARAKNVVEMALGLYANGRNLVRRLRPEVLEVMGLRGAIEEMLRLYNEGGQSCHFSFQSEGEFSSLSSDLALSVYRIIQEASSNIMKHAQASEAMIDLRMRDGRLVIKVSDNGHGFDTEQMSAGIGLTGMRERCVFLNGHFQIESKIGKGTEVQIDLPIT
ncbi:HAMP domain-containing protein [Undibacterium cyanobacteriorum]|uniref:Oxygen sensor histidine kinase NreB n=1 Tax=Undibacterium cyanobacteriorum TaxID=3073561 RepID=A0ABY9RKZ9_9BURK|nr:ATP-binding protein [Undibacterium sp. 20NA77.5]WMW81872.1 HAMP domain-containing protein [Undibacterium sp. 20NA77.5]